MSSILTGSTIPPKGWTTRLSVAVAHLLFAEGSVDPARNRVPEPNHGPEKKDGKRQLKSVNHESTP